MEEQEERLFHRAGRGRAGSLRKSGGKDLLFKPIKEGNARSGKVFAPDTGEQVSSFTGQEKRAFFRSLYRGEPAGGQFGKNRTEHRSGNQ